jgi:cytochrome d ubiquinol oxidase subunit I
MKIAAAEGLFESQDPAPFSLITIGDLSGRNEVFSIRLPSLLSLLAYNQLTGKVQGINELQAQYEAQYGPGNYVPPAWATYWSFRLMVGAGTVMLLLAAYGVFLAMGELLEAPRKPRFFKLYVYAMLLPYLATTAGWMLTELGRYPWVVFGLMKIEDAVSPNVSVGMLLVTLIGFTLVYGVLMAADLYLLAKAARAGAGALEPPATAPALPNLVGAD